MQACCRSAGLGAGLPPHLAPLPEPLGNGALHKKFKRYGSLRQQMAYAGVCRVEFEQYLPDNTQGVIVQPIGDQGVLIAATDTQRGFGKLDQVCCCSG